MSLLDDQVDQVLAEMDAALDLMFFGPDSDGPEAQRRWNDMVSHWLPVSEPKR